MRENQIFPGRVGMAALSTFFFFFFFFTLVRS